VTTNWCDPTASARYAFGDVHPVAAAPSSEHVKLASRAFALNSNIADVSDVVPDGPLVIVTASAAVAATAEVANATTPIAAAAYASPLDRRVRALPITASASFVVVHAPGN
jgi:hypothetical protein